MRQERMNHAREPLFFEAIQIRRPPTQGLKICADPGANILCSRNTINCLSSMSWGNLHEQLSFHFVCQEQDGRRASVQKRNCFFSNSHRNHLYHGFWARSFLLGTRNDALKTDWHPHGLSQTGMVYPFLSPRRVPQRPFHFNPLHLHGLDAPPPCLLVWHLTSFNTLIVAWSCWLNHHQMAG